MMKRICIVTVYNSLNCGSYWQAFVLAKFLENHGCEVKFLERKGNRDTSNKFSKMFCKMILATVKHGIGHGGRIWKRFFEFKKFERDFALCQGTDYSQIDCFVLGSDTIWNVDSRYFANRRGRYWGSDFAGYKTISYAASSANTGIDTIRKYPELVGAVNRLSAISVRDQHTKDIVSEMTSKKVEIVCDPTLLWNKNDYFKIAGDRPSQNYIFLYLFSPLSVPQMAYLKKFAAENNMFIIGGTGVTANCDMYIVNSPRRFLQYMYYADFIVTDTFHGTVFSANLEKRFAVIKRGKNKVDEFLACNQLTDRLTDEDDITKTLLREIDYENVRSILEDKRDFSRTYLLNSLEIV